MTRADPHFDSLLPRLPCDRRGFVVGLLATGFAAALAPALAQTAIHTDDEGLLAGEIRVPAGRGEIPAYLAEPTALADGEAFPVVLVVHEVFGVHEYIKDICRRLAKAGYQAIAPDLYFRQGDAAAAATVDDALAIAAAAPDEQVLGDLDACVAWAALHGGDLARLYMTGFCRGGRTVWLYAARNSPLKAAVAWYGPLDGAPSPLQPTQPLDLGGKLKAPVLGLYGGRDQGISAEQIEEMNEDLASGGGGSQIHVYPEAGHAFHADYRPTYRRAEAEDGWRRMLDWFDRHGVAPEE